MYIEKYLQFRKGKLPEIRCPFVYTNKKIVNEKIECPHHKHFVPNDQKVQENIECKIVNRTH